MSKLKAEYDWNGKVSLFIGDWEVMSWEAALPEDQGEDENDYADRIAARKLRELFTKLEAL